VPEAGDGRYLRVMSQPRQRIDETDRRIIRSLLVDAKTPCQQIAKELNVHPSTIAYRIRKLLESGVIKKFSVSVDWRKLGKNVEAAILIDAAQRDVRKLAEHLSSLDEVIEVHSVAGYHDLLIMVVTTDMDEFRRFLEDKLGKIPQIEKINTAIVMEDFKEE
jgi:Lrp/AsnC family transcriptional regulator for asnA, asnC and gidA